VEQPTAAAGFNGATIQFYYDDLTLALTRCEATDVPDGWSITATANDWSHNFTTSESVAVDGVVFASAELDGIAFSFMSL